MNSQRYILLNKFLLACIFIGIVMILIKEREGFASHYHNIDELYKGPLLKKIDKTRKYSLRKRNIPLKQDIVIRVNNYSDVTDNYTLHPCNDNGKYNDICSAMYKVNDVVIGPKQKSCMPGLGCRRVGFYCSLID